MPSRTRRVGFGSALTMIIIMTPALASGDLEEKVRHATEAYKELLRGPDGEVPEKLLRGSKCVGVLPQVVKAALGVGGRYGAGIVSCRGENGAWGPPAFVTMSGASIGFQIGAASTDLVLFFMSERGTRSLLKSKITLGADASVAAGPVGRTAEGSTDLKLNAEIYAYARAKGLFAGISLEGAVLRPSPKRNEEYYGKEIPPEEILFQHRVPRTPAGARAFMAALPRGG